MEISFVDLKWNIASWYHYAVSAVIVGVQMIIVDVIE